MAAGCSTTPANLGLLDLLEALRCIGHNIAPFGGDQPNVTLFGQSAGGDAIAHLMIADGTRGLFRRGIIQSAPLGIATNRRAMTASMATSASEVEPFLDSLTRQVRKIQDPAEAVVEAIAHTLEQLPARSTSVC